MRKWLCVCMVLLFLPLASCARTQNPALEDFAACIGMTQRQVVRRLGLGEENSVIYEGFINLREPRRIGEVDFDTALRFDESTGRLRSVVLSCRAGSDCAAAFDAVAAFARTCEGRYGAPQETAFSEFLSYAAYEDVPPNDYAAAVWELPVKGFQRTRLRRVWRDCAAASLMLEVKYSHKARFDGQECRAWISYSCAAATEEERAQEPVTEMNLPGGLRPSILVDGKLYRWTRLSRDMHVFEKDGRLVLKDSATYLPESYIPVGEISPSQTPRSLRRNYSFAPGLKRRAPYIKVRTIRRWCTCG